MRLFTFSLSLPLATLLSSVISTVVSVAPVANAQEICSGPGVRPGDASWLFPSFADAATEALWLFDDVWYPGVTLTDASSNEYDLRLMAGGQLEQSPYGTALRVAPGSGYKVIFAGFQGSISNHHMRMPDGIQSGLWSPTAAPLRLVSALACGGSTTEFRLKLVSPPTADTHVLDLGDALQPGYAIVLEKNASALKVVNAYAGTVTRFALTSGKFVTDRWQHVAIVVHSPRDISLFIDGVKQAAGVFSASQRQPLPPDSEPTNRQHENRGFTKDSSVEWKRDHRFNLAIGEDRQGYGALDGWIDEIRVSSVARYGANFRVPSSFSRNYSERATPSARPVGLPLLFDTRQNPGPGPLQLGSRKHLFIDMAFIEQKKSVKIKVNPLTRPEPLKLATPNGLTNFDPAAGGWRETIYDHDGKIHLFVGDGYSSEQGLTRLYTSQDGLTFEAPSLHKIEFKGSTDNNFILAGKPQGATVFKDENPDSKPEERFKLTSWDANRGIYLYVSPDGINWRRNEVAMLPIAIGSDPESFWDDQRGLYFSHVKRDSSPPQTQSEVYGRADVQFQTDDPFKPWPFTRLANPYFESWPFPTLSDEGQMALPPRKDIKIGGLKVSEEVYRSRAIKYPWAPDTYVAFPLRSFRSGFTQHRQTEFAASRNGETWIDYPYDDRNWLMPAVGQIDGVDTTDALAFQGMIRRGDEIWLYVEYTTDGAPNGKDGLKRYARLRMPLDRFSALNAGRSGGEATTQSFVFDGKRLELNLSTLEGALRVAILDENGRTIPGFSFEDCDALANVDDIRRRITWNGSDDLSSLAGKAIRLRFDMNNAKIFALQFVP